MKFRYKLLILMLCISILPLIILRTLASHEWQKLEHEIVSEVTVGYERAAAERLQLYVQGLARNIQNRGELFVLAAASQGDEAQELLQGPVPLSPAPISYVETFSQNGQKDMVSESRYYRIGKAGHSRAFDVSFSRPAFKIPIGISKKSVDEDIRKLAYMTSVFRDMRIFVDNDALWQMIILNNGLVCVYPGTGELPRGYDPRFLSWYQDAVEKGQSFTAGFVDAVTRQRVTAAVSPIKDKDGKIIGVSAIVIPLAALVRQSELAEDVAGDADLFLVYSAPDATGRGFELSVFAGTKEAPGAPHRGWHSYLEPVAMKADDSGGLSRIAADLVEEESGIRVFARNGQNSLWVYTPTGGRSGILAVMPVTDFMAPVQRTRHLIESKISEMTTTIGFILLIGSILIVLIALFFSRTVTQPLQKLTAGAQKLADGDFNVNLEVTSKDELGYMTQTFNEVVPQLRNYMQMSHSLALARELQLNLLPKADPHVEGWDIAGLSWYCEGTGGDYYDYIYQEENKRLLVMVGDVSGHGIEAALLMTTARAFLRQRAALPGDLGAVARDVNNELFNDVYESGRFMTLFLLEIDLRTRRVSWVRAGHDPAYVYDPATENFATLSEGSGPPLGVLDNFPYAPHEQDVSPGEVIFIGTDGIWELHNEQREMFGKQRLRHVIQKHALDGAKTIQDVLIQELRDFQGDAETCDDVTMVVIKVDPDHPGHSG